MTYPMIIHGSENSLDIDAYVIVPKILERGQAKQLCDSYKEVNANLIFVENGEVKWSYKGTTDECNNSILATYHLHEQTHPCPVTHAVARNAGLKMLRTLRGMLGYNSRTELRDVIKKALQSSSLDEKMTALRQVNLHEIKDFQKTTLIETYKFFAFQLGQTLALIEDNQELFTKNAVAKYYPQLAPYLNREKTQIEPLAQFWDRFLSFIEKAMQNTDNTHAMIKSVDKQPLLLCTYFHGVKEVLDVKKEMLLPPVVVFDVDGTLLDETHRKHLRDEKKWEEYFDACDKDTPIAHIIALTHEYKSKGYEVWLMTGRADIGSCREKTIASFKEHGVVYDHLKMRSQGVMIPDHVLKPAWIAKYIGKERVEVIYDDRAPVIEGFRKKGLNVIDVTTLNKDVKDVETRKLKP